MGKSLTVIKFTFMIFFGPIREIPAIITITNAISLRVKSTFIKIFRSRIMRQLRKLNLILVQSSPSIF